MSDALDEIVIPSFTRGAEHKDLPATKDPDWPLAKQAVIKRLRKARVCNLRPSAPKNVVVRLFHDEKVGSNSGWPIFTRRKFPEAYKAAVRDAAGAEWKDYPAIALFRYYNGKLRLVWMYPFAGNVHESCYYFPFQDAIQRSELSKSFYSPWAGFETVKNVVTKAYASSKMVCASDFTATDEHFQFALTREVADVISAAFRPEYRDGILEMMEHMHSIPLVISPTTMLTGPHGVPSGSSGTNLVETVADHIFGTWVSMKTDGVIQPLFGIGDDMAWVVPRDTDSDFVKSALAKYGEMIGQVIQPKKTTAEPNKVKTLQRLFQRGFKVRGSSELRGVYSTIRALKSSVWPERYHSDPEDPFDKRDFCVRQFQILENCVDHPLFEEFVEFVCRGNKHLIPFAQQSPAELDAAARRAKRFTGLQVSYNQEKAAARLSSFASIRIAARLRK
jgi:hypothetical protein